MMTYVDSSGIIRNDYIESGVMDEFREIITSNSYSYEPPISYKDLMTVARTVSFDPIDSITIKSADKKLGIRKVIFNDPATIVIWDDGEKTVVKTNDEEFSKEHGLAMAITKRYFGSRSQFLKAVENGCDKHVEAEETETENS